MEINPRLSGWASLAEADGAGFLDAYYRICTEEIRLEEACLQQSTTEYIRLSGTLSHLPDWFIQHPSKWSRFKAVLSLLARHYHDRSLHLGAWDKKDFKASLSILWYSFTNLWKH